MSVTSSANSVVRAVEQNQATSQTAQPSTLSFRLLLGIYAVIPLAIAVMGADVLFLDGRLRRILPNSPYEWWVITALFNLPHIFASQFSFFDREYANHYPRMLEGMPLVALFALLLATFMNPIGFAIFELITIYHVIFQQVGITHMMMGETNSFFVWWKWLLLSAFAFAYVGLALEVRFILLAVMVGPLLIPTTYLAYRAARDSRTRTGRNYLWANQLMLLVAAACYPLRYPMFSVLIPRIIHDTTAFAFYINHDYNRNRVSTRNFIYRHTNKLCVPVPLACPLLALGVNGLLIGFANMSVNPFFYAPITMIHYYTERLIWRRGTIHRKSVFIRP